MAERLEELFLFPKLHSCEPLRHTHTYYVHKNLIDIAEF